MQNAYAVIDSQTGQQLARVVDASDDLLATYSAYTLIPIPPEQYEAMDAFALDSFIVSEGARLGIAVLPSLNTAYQPNARQLQMMRENEDNYAKYGVPLYTSDEIEAAQ